MNLPLDYIIQEIKKNLPIMDVAEEFGLKLKRSGHSYFILCPVHGEKTPSCSLVPNTDSTKDYFNCFGCGAGEDQIYLFAVLSNISNGQAINFLANRFGLSKNSTLPEPFIREYAKNKRDRTVEKNFLIAYKQVFYELCCIRDMIVNLAQQHEFMELIEQDDLLIKYYNGKEDFEMLLELLLSGLFEEITYSQQIDVFLKAKGVVTEWENLLQKR